MQSLGATQTTISITTRTFLDLLSSPTELGYFAAIAEEAAEVFQNEEDWGNLASLHKLSRIDSTIRESLRLNPLSGRGVMHTVIHKKGVTMPDGQHLPRGALVGVSLADISQDERYYPDPHNYDPFRFSRARSEIALMAKTKSLTPNKAISEKINSIEAASEKCNDNWSWQREP